MDDWAALQHYLEIIFSLDDGYDGKRKKLTGLKILEEWFSNYGTAAIVNNKVTNTATHPYSLPGMKEFLNKYFIFFIQPYMSESKSTVFNILSQFLEHHWERIFDSKTQKDIINSALICDKSVPVLRTVWLKLVGSCVNYLIFYDDHELMERVV
jgi:hypothetical protein